MGIYERCEDMRMKVLSLLLMLLLLLGASAPGFADAVPAQSTQGKTTTDVQIIKNEVKAWEMMEFQVSNPPTTENAWVGLYEYKYVEEGEVYYWSSDYKSKIMVKNLGDTPYFDTPRDADETQYVIAVFDKYGYDLTPVAVSDPILVHMRYTPPNSFIPEEAEAARQYYILVSNAKSDGTYDIKSIMNNDFFNPNITDAEIARYRAFLNSNTIHEYERKNVQGADGMWSQIGPSDNWKSCGSEYVDYESTDNLEAYANEDHSALEYGDDYPSEEVTVIISDNINYNASTAGPTSETVFSIDGPHTLTYIELLYAPVTDYFDESISLVDQNGVKYGPWTAYVDLPYEDEPYSLCYLDLYEEIPAGSYRIEVGHPAKWLSNAESNFAGMAFVQGNFTFKTGPSLEDTQYIIPERIFDNTNSSDAVGNPVTTTLFFLNQPYTITHIDLRYRADIESSGETISIINADGTSFGTWETTVDPNYRSESTLYCRVDMNTLLPEGAYRIEVAHPDKWLSNSGSRFAGMATLEARPQDPNKTAQIVYGSVYGMTWDHEGNYETDVTIKCFQNENRIMKTNSQDTSFYAYELPVGSYDFEFSKAGYETQYFKDKIISQDTPLRLDVNMIKSN